MRSSGGCPSTIPYQDRSLCQASAGTNIKSSFSTRRSLMWNESKSGRTGDLIYIPFLFRTTFIVIKCLFLSILRKTILKEKTTTTTDRRTTLCCQFDLEMMTSSGLPSPQTPSIVHTNDVPPCTCTTHMLAAVEVIIAPHTTLKQFHLDSVYSETCFNRQPR